MNARESVFATRIDEKEAETTAKDKVNSSKASQARDRTPPKKNTKSHLAEQEIWERDENNTLCRYLTN